MQVIDLTYIMTSDMPVFPGSEPASFMQAADFDKDGYNEKRLCLHTHTGTHIDCKKHIYREGFDTASASERFAGKGFMIDCQVFTDEIPVEHMQQFDQQIRQTEFVLLHTGCSKYWGLPDYFRKFPVLSRSASLYLSNLRLKGIGIDAPSFDPFESSDLPVHHTLLSADMVLVENLTNLGALTGFDFMFFCLPLKIKDGDGSPVRATAITGIKS
jgi:kynurenine formamidase